MILYFLRHANAGKKRADVARDRGRPLDADGVSQCRLVGRCLAGLNVSVDVVISSPLRRATQTGALVANEIGFDAKIERDLALAPEAEYPAFRGLLQRHRNREALLLVGHNPSLSNFLSRLVAGAGTSMPLALKKAGVAKVEIVGRQSQLEWMLTPRLAQSIYSMATASARPKMRRK